LSAIKIGKGTWQMQGQGGGGSKYGSGGQTPDDMQKKADERNLDIRYPKGNELFVDIDNARDFARFKTLIEMFGRVERVMGWADTPSASGGQHRHVVVTLARDVSQFERIAFQAMLGSDLKREVLSFERLRSGMHPNPSVFFEPKPGSKPVAKSTGHNCKACNFRNDFAEANQDDGTYLCFNCRVDEE
jgi:hypothetical protein